MPIMNSLHTINRTLVGPLDLAAAGSTSADINLAKVGADSVTIVLKVGFGASPDEDVIFNFYTSVDSGVNYTNAPFSSIEITRVASSSQSKDVTFSGKPLIQMISTNSDSTDAVTLESTYSYQKFGDAARG